MSSIKPAMAFRVENKLGDGGEAQGGSWVST